MSAQNGAQRCAVHGDRLAEPQSQVCRSCEDDVRRALDEAPGLYHDLAEPLRSKGGSGGKSDPATRPGPITHERIEVRDQLKTALVGWCVVLWEDHRITTPADTIDAIAEHVSRWRLKLLGTDAAEGLVSDCRDILDLQRVAWPSRWTGVKVACPCGSTVRITADNAGQLIACPGCKEWGTVEWWQERVAADTWRPMLLKDVTTWLILVQRMSVTSKQVSKWVERAQARKDGPAEAWGYMFDVNGRVLYDPEQVMRLAPQARRTAA